MEHLAAILFIVACPTDTSNCREASAPQPFFESVEVCKLERQSYVNAFIDGNQLLSTCIPVEPDLVFEDAQLIWEVSDQLELTAEVRKDADSAGSGES